MEMRRSWMAAMLGVFAVAAPLAAQTSVTDGNWTFTYSGSSTIVDVFIQSIGTGTYSRFDLLFSRRGGDDVFATARLVGGATRVGSMSGTGAPIFDWGTSQTADVNGLFTGGIGEDPFDFYAVTCNDIAPIVQNGQTFYGGQTSYFKACGPDQGVDFQFTVNAHVTLASLVTTTPEPASLALMATGLIGIGGALVRRKRSMPT